MIIESTELQQLERAIEREDIELKKDTGISPITRFLHKNPHLLLLLGFDEFRLLWKSKKNVALIEDYLGVGEGVSFPTKNEALYRRIDSGEWELFEGTLPHGEYKNYSLPGMKRRVLHFLGYKKKDERILLEKFVNRASEYISAAKFIPKCIVLPSLWLPEQQRLQQITLVESVRSLIEAVDNEKVSLREISWRQLEELVAELLRSQGMQIQLTPRSHDGGRDIVARGELVPGEPMMLAVEVKQKPVVGIYDVQRAMKANEDFPALIVATAGRFSAGVVEEKEKQRNFFRLFLKDGVALNQWIKTYKRKI